MNCSKPLPIAIAFALFTVLATPSRAADSASKPAQELCRDVAEYVVRDLSFAKTNSESALRKLIEGTPLQLRYLDKAPQRQIGAEHVTGDLSIVLKDFASEAGITWFQSKCSVIVPDSTIADPQKSADDATQLASKQEAKPLAESKAASAIVSTPADVTIAQVAVPIRQEWIVRKGQRFSDALSEWCRRASCPGVFWEAIELESGIQQSFAGTYFEAVNTAVETLAKQGLPIRAVYYSGNDVFRIMGKK